MTPRSFEFLKDRSSLVADWMRGVILLAAFAVACGFLLILLPQAAFDRLVQGLQSRGAAPAPKERIAFLYLGDEVKDNQFHIRGVIRNISAVPIEKLDASIRLYGQDGTLLETAVVRMDSEQIAPEATSEFHLAYPDYHGQFGSYSIDFKWRQGDSVPYKDFRGVRNRS